jgi:hypothetical protein
MKKITPREMKWINKGFIKSLSYNRFEAKGNDSYFLAVSDEDFEFISSVSLLNRNVSLIISITEKTFFSLNIEKDAFITISINGFKSIVNLNSSIYDNKDYLKIKIVREKDSFSFFIEDELISKATLPASLDAISFGYCFTNNEFVKVKDILYIKK